MRADESPTRDISRPVPHSSPVVRSLLLVVGLVAVALGVVGAFLPVLPTTPFLLVGAACFARASPRLHGRLVRSKTFGPTLEGVHSPDERIHIDTVPRFYEFLLAVLKAVA